MPVFSLIQFASLVIVIASNFVVPKATNFMIVVMCATFVHYLLVFAYSKEQLLWTLRQRRSTAGLSVLTILALLCSRGNLNLLAAIFGIHVVFNEVYLLHRVNLRPLWHHLGLFRTSSCVFAILLYAIALRQVFSVFQFPLMPLCVAAAIAGLIFAFALFKARAVISAKSFIDLCSLNIIAAILVAISMFTKVDVFDVVLFHVAFLTIYQLLRLWKSPKSTIGYLFLNVLGFMGVMHLSPLSNFPNHFLFGQMVDQFKFWSFIYVFSSLSISTAHPDWVIRLLQPNPALASLVPKTFKTTLPEVFGTAVSGKIINVKSVK